MGLNWSEGLLETSKGLKGLQAARERTLELDYRNRRDANLRRFTLEDQARDDRLLGEKHTYDEGIDARKLLETDEAKGLGDTERATIHQEQKDKDRKEKQEDHLQRIYAENAGKIAAKYRDLTKRQYVDRGMRDLEKVWTAAIDITKQGKNRMMPQFEKSMWRKALGVDWEKMQEISGSNPFSPERDKEDADDLRSIIGDMD